MAGLRREILAQRPSGKQGARWAEIQVQQRAVSNPHRHGATRHARGAGATGGAFAS